MCKPMALESNATDEIAVTLSNKARNKKFRKFLKRETIFLE